MCATKTEDAKPTVNVRVFYYNSGLGGNPGSPGEAKFIRVIGYMHEKSPAQQNFKTDYVEVWGGSITPRATDESTCELLWRSFNDYSTNPLSAENGGQQKLREAFGGEGMHTSMSMGDIVVLQSGPHGQRVYQAVGEGFQILDGIVAPEVSA